jgi:hypothetical protein
MENENFDLIEDDLSKKENRGGKREGSGRKPGTPNKVSTTVKQNVISVFDEIGGIEAMATWAKDNRSEYYRIYSRLAPVSQEISGADGADLPLSIGLRFVEPDTKSD